MTLMCGLNVTYHILCNAQQVIQCHWPRCVAIHDNGDIYVGSDDHMHLLCLIK